MCALLLHTTESATLTSGIDQHLASIKDKNKKTNPDDTAASAVTAAPDAGEVVNLDSVSLGGPPNGPTDPKKKRCSD